jgi:hypothetical protein
MYDQMPNSLSLPLESDMPASFDSIIEMHHNPIGIYRTNDGKITVDDLD